MRTIVAAALLCLAIALMLPLLFAGGGQAEPAPSAEPESAAGGLDSELSFTVLTADGVETVTMSDWLPGVVAGEMPALFEEEALKAQAVAARTYIMYSMGREKPAHPEADVCDDPACCKAHSTDEALREKWGESYEENMARVLEAVRSTDGEYMSYGGEVIQAVFHSSSAGRTEDSAAIWQAEPYRVSVESPETAEDVPNYVTSVTVSPEDFRAAVLAVHPAAEFGEDPAISLGAAERAASGTRSRLPASPSRPSTLRPRSMAASFATSTLALESVTMTASSSIASMRRSPSTASASACPANNAASLGSRSRSRLRPAR